MIETTQQAKLTDARGLLEEVFAKRGRPSLRWLRQQQKLNVIPHVRVAGKVFYDPAAVRAALARSHQTADVARPLAVKSPSKVGGV
jgi:hypothetical protein